MVKFNFVNMKNIFYLLLTISFFSYSMTYVDEWSDSKIEELEKLIFENGPKISEAISLLEGIRKNNEEEFITDLEELNLRIKKFIKEDGDDRGIYLEITFCIEETILSLKLYQLYGDKVQVKISTLSEKIDVLLSKNKFTANEKTILFEQLLNYSASIREELKKSDDDVGYWLLKVKGKQEEELYSIIYVEVQGKIKYSRVFNGVFGEIEDARVIKSIQFDQENSGIVSEIEVSLFSRQIEFLERTKILDEYNRNRFKRQEEIRAKSKTYIDEELYKKRAEYKGSIPPEGQGDDLTSLSTPELLDKFDMSSFEEIYKQRQNWKNPKCIELRKAAQVLGDRSLAGTLILSKEQKRKIDRIVTKYLEIASNDNFGEASTQIRRFWDLATLALIENLGHEKGEVMGTAMQFLYTYKSEKVVDLLIAQFNSTQDKTLKKRYVLTLRQMKNSYEVGGFRRANLEMTKEETLELYQRKIEPFLKSIYSGSTNPDR